VERLSHLPFEDAGFAKIDHHRSLRLGLPEVIYSAGKTPEQVAENTEARIVSLRQTGASPTTGPVAVLCAGTSDIPVAEEAAVTAKYLGVRVERVYDVGVAGLHRLLAQS
jgi:hypothetical protein